MRLVHRLDEREIAFCMNQEPAFEKRTVVRQRKYERHAVKFVKQLLSSPSKIATHGLHLFNRHERYIDLRRFVPALIVRVSHE